MSMKNPRKIVHTRRKVPNCLHSKNCKKKDVAKTFLLNCPTLSPLPPLLYVMGKVQTIIVIWDRWAHSEINCYCRSLRVVNVSNVYFYILLLPLLFAWEKHRWGLFFLRTSPVRLGLQTENKKEKCKAPRE